ncbi:hypothetical protein GOP47_0013806 [Adiantum capillus-veneris]|uniref:Uncharacterized protein n=1 Tax=Adiantum capillus-veneris TaxID=13818 RepID=A0A9D4UPH1_ADICA|nr:hypothetical protein GOP47_0013806 [Adiantum capillus-veneris]
MACSTYGPTGLYLERLGTVLCHLKSNDQSSEFQWTTLSHTFEQRSAHCKFHQATEVADERSAKDLSLRVQTAHRAIQMSKQIHAAHKDMVQMSRAMQAAAEKLS